MKVIKLTQGKKAFVDDGMHGLLSQYKWYARTDGVRWYATRMIPSLTDKKRDNLQMHHLVVGYPMEGFKPDHINGNGLDNRKDNLRIVSNRINCLNNSKMRSGKKTSRYPGVSWDKRRNKWIAQAYINGLHRNLGRYQNEEDAFSAYRSQFS